MHLLKFHRIRGPQDSDGHRGVGEGRGEEEAKEEDGIKRGARGLCNLVELLRKAEVWYRDGGGRFFPAGYAHEPSNLNLAKPGH